MKRFSWILTVPVTLVIVIFSVANRERITIDLWPLDRTIDPPLFVLVLCSLLVGFCLGAAVMWISDGRTRDRARQSYYKASHLERELAAVKRKQAQGATAAGPGLPAAHQKS